MKEKSSASNISKEELEKVLLKFQRGELSLDETIRELTLAPLLRLSSACLDLQRAARRGFPEVVMAEGKTPEQFGEIFSKLCERSSVVLATRCGGEHFEVAAELGIELFWDPLSRVLFTAPATISERGRGKIGVITAGTADLKAAREAYITALLMGNSVELIPDIGVAGLHRLGVLLERLPHLEVLIVAAGMEGALPSVVGGLSDRPVIALPTSNGYGTGEGGKAALMAMLNSCAAGVTVVNIDNGFGAGYAASLINRERAEGERGHLELESYLSPLGGIVRKRG